MNHLNNQSKRSGFMLIEVVLAITLLAISAIPLLNLQANLLKNVWRQQDEIDRLWILQNLFFTPEIQKITRSSYTQTRSFEQKNTAYFNDLKYECLPINSKSELANHFSDLYLTRSSGSWSGVGGDYEDRVISFVYIAPVIEKAVSDETKKESKI